MKIKFDIKYRPQIESGLYTVVLDCGIEAEILAWDKPGDYPIVCMAKREDAVPFRVDNNGNAYHLPNRANYSKLLLVTPEEEELTEFEKKVCEIMYSDNPKYDASASDTWKQASAELLIIARKEIHEEIIDSGGMIILESDYDKNIKQALDQGKEETLKDLPRWKKDNVQGICSERYRVCRIWDKYFLFDQSEQKVISISDLEKLPKEG